MRHEFKRTDRIAETMRRLLAKVIQEEIRDPRLPKLISISAVEVSKDLSHAKIYFTALDATNQQEVAILLTSASSYLRKGLAKAMLLRIVPQLHFIYDESVEYGKNLSRLIDSANSSDDHDPEQ